MGWFGDISEEGDTCPMISNKKASSMKIPGRGCFQTEGMGFSLLSRQLIAQSDTQQEPSKYLQNLDY